MLQDESNTLDGMGVDHQPGHVDVGSTLCRVLGYLGEECVQRYIVSQLKPAQNLIATDIYCPDATPRRPTCHDPSMFR